MGSKKSTLINLKLILAFFTKNFGHQSAVFAGLSNFEADLYLVLDSDLQHDPNLIGVMIKNLNEFIVK